MRLGEIHGTPMGRPLFAADRTDSKFYAYTPRHTERSTATIMAGHIYLCDLVDDEGPERYLRILCHELFHFVDDEKVHEIVNRGKRAGRWSCRMRTTRTTLRCLRCMRIWGGRRATH